MNKESKQLLVIKVTIFIAFIAMSITYPIMPAIFIHANNHTTGFLNQLPPQTNLLLMMSVYPFGMFLGSYILGSCSDKVGKRKIFIISLSLAAFFQLLCGYFIVQNQLFLFIVVRFFSGFFEGNVAIARAAIATVCPDETMRKKHLSHANAALTLGWLSGPPIGAFLSEINLYNGFLLPFLFGALLTSVGFLFAYYYFYEVNSSKNQSKSEKNEKAPGFLQPKIILLLSMSFLIFLGIDTFYIFVPVYVAFTINSSPVMLALTTVTVGIANAASNIFLLSRVHKIISTRSTMIVCMILLSLCLIFLVPAKSIYILFIIFLVIGINIALINSNVSTYMSLQLKQEKQGKLMGILLSQRTLGAAILSLTFAFFTRIDFTLPFFFGALFLIMAVLLFVLYLFSTKEKVVCKTL